MREKSQTSDGEFQVMDWQVEGVLLNASYLGTQRLKERQDIDMSEQLIE